MVWKKRFSGPPGFFTPPSLPHLAMGTPRLSGGAKFGRGKNIRGFSLFELLVVLGLVMVIIGLIGVQVGCLRSALVRAEIEKIETICCYLRCLAQTSNKPCTLTFDINKGQYQYAHIIEELPKFLYFGVKNGILGPPSAPTGVIKKGVTFPGNQIIFHPSGVMHAGTIYLSDSLGSYVGALSCAVSQVSYVRKYCYVNGRWQLLK